VLHEVVESTSDSAVDLLQQGVVDLPLLVWAKTQTQGRGRGTNQWWSDQGSLTFTLAIDPLAHGLALHHEPKLALAAAVAVIDALDELEIAPREIGIRWPNDLEVDGLKLGGILLERVDTAWGNRLLIGVGLNVQTNLERAPAEVRAMATSLEVRCPGRLDAGASGRLLAVLLGRFETLLCRLAGGDPTLAARWNELDRLRDRWVSVDRGKSVVAGWGRGIDVDGALCLDDGAERLRLYGGRVLRLAADV
jgi:BirA family biotin operon repressor/biotin-[acetyl-CoA-carboxylase] ligase